MSSSNLISPEDARRTCEDTQHVIEASTVHLEQLRSLHQEQTIDATKEFTQKEIRNYEEKLIRLFSKQLAVKLYIQKNFPNSLLAFQQYPSLSQWLRVVGVTQEFRKVFESKFSSLDELKDKSEHELLQMLLLTNSSCKLSSGQRNDDLRRLSRAMHNLKKYNDSQRGDSKIGISTVDTSKLELYWDSWKPSQPSSFNTGEAMPYSSHRTDLPSSSIPSGLSSAPMSLISSHDHLIKMPPPYKPDSVASSPSSNSSFTSSLPPPSPGLTLSPPVMPWGPERKATPPSTPPARPTAASIFGAKNQSQKFPTTPPPNKKHSTTFISNCSTIISTSSTSAQVTSTSSKSDYPLTKSKSQECELGNRIYPYPNSSAISSISSTSCIENTTINEEEHPKERALSHVRRKRFPTDSGTSCIPDEEIDPGPSPLPSPSFIDCSLADSGSSSSSSLQVPKSPRTPRSMGHAIRHIFKKTLKPGRCDHCSERMLGGLKCKECKFKCHKDCENKVPPSCCLPEELVNYVKQITKEPSPILPHMRAVGIANDPALPRIGTNTSIHNPAYPDSSSNTSSCNSSTPSSPAVMVTSTQPTPPHSASIYNRGTKFTFPDPPVPPVTLKLHDQPMPQQRVTSPNPIIDSVKSYDSDKTLSGSSGSAGTAYRLDSQDSTASVDETSSTWNAGRQTSISLREWDIPYEEIVVGEKIGSGRFSTVHQGNWHGDVAIKILNMENIDDDATLEAFRLDVSTFRQTRHENLILFMGACTNPPKLAIVTSLCKGNTLYTLLHLRKDKCPFNKYIQIAQQIAQGMGYLHHRRIVHKDLKTKNIFLENGHAIIADFGLVNVARRLCSRQTDASGSKNSHQINSMNIPEGWLCYLAPEIMRVLKVRPDEGEDLPFTKATDIFAFGTVWYELLTGEWPWKNLPPETIIYMVGNGMKPRDLQFSKEVNDILLMCWTYKPEHRPDFTYLSDMLMNIPQKTQKKRGLIRSPSYPVHLCKSAEAMF